MSFIDVLALVAVMGMMMGCAESPRRVTLAHLNDGSECYVEEDSKTIPKLYCNGKLSESIPMAMVTR